MQVLNLSTLLMVFLLFCSVASANPIRFTVKAPIPQDWQQDCTSGDLATRCPCPPKDVPVELEVLREEAIKAQMIKNASEQKNDRLPLGVPIFQRMPGPFS